MPLELLEVIQKAESVGPIALDGRALDGGTGAVACTLVEPASLALGWLASGARIDPSGGATSAPSLPAAAAAGALAFFRRGGIAQAARACRLQNQQSSLLKRAPCPKLQTSPRSRRVSQGPEGQRGMRTGRIRGRETLGHQNEPASLPRPGSVVAQTQTRHTAQLTPLRHAAGAMIRAILIMSSLAGAMVSTPRLRAADVGDAAALHARFVDYIDEPLRHKIDHSIKILEDALRVFGPDAVYACVEINQCVECTR